jgi:type I restriction enzyme R subunit
LLHGLLWNRFVDEGASNRERMDLISDGINFVFGFSDDCRASFLRESLALKQAGSLCQSLLTREERYSQAFVEAVRVGVGKIVHPGKVSLREINRQVAELLEQSVRSEGVINLFEDVDEEFSIFDEKFLAEVLAMKRRNLAAELLRKLLDEQIRIFKRTNLVQAEKFSERMKKIMNAYRNGQLTNAQVIDELRSMAGEIAEARGKGDELGLNDEELAFYDALTKPAAVKDVYTNDELKAMVQELADELRSSRTIDWQKKDSARAGMRRKVKKLLKKYKYPPEGQDDALKTVIEQCEMWADAG